MAKNHRTRLSYDFHFLYGKTLFCNFICRCMIAFPDDYKTLVPKVLIETMATVGASFVSRINLATGDVVPETRGLAKG